MNAFFFVRHGLTDANTQKLLCGSAWDIALNAEGQKMAEEAATLHRAALSSVKLICSSPLLRARQTAQAFADVLHLPITLHEDLKEQDLGVWERQPWASTPEFFSGTKDPPLGETRQQFDRRIQRALSELTQLPEPILIVSHGALWYRLNHLLSLPPEQPGSCVPYSFVKEDGNFRRQKL